MNIEFDCVGCEDEYDIIMTICNGIDSNTYFIKLIEDTYEVAQKFADDLNLCLIEK